MTVLAPTPTVCNSAGRFSTTTRTLAPNRPTSFFARIGLIHFTNPLPRRALACDSFEPDFRCLARMGRIVERMAKRKSKSQPKWTDVKTKLADFDRAALLGLIQSLYAAHKENQTFLHARFGLAEGVLEPYKKTIDRWLWPDVFRRQDTSVWLAEMSSAESCAILPRPSGNSEPAVDQAFLS